MTTLYTQREKLLKKYLILQSRSVLRMQRRSIRHFISEISHRFELHSKEFGRIATQNAKNLILQKIREEERKVVFDQYFEKEKDIVTGIVQRYVGKNISVNLGKADAILTENEQVKGEVFRADRAYQALYRRS